MSDNSTIDLKIRLRRERTAELPSTACVLEAFVGESAIYDAVWRRFARGACFDRDPIKVRHAADRRPGWACYVVAESGAVLESGFGASRAWDVVDLDCWGSPWRFLLAFLGRRAYAPTTHVFLTDGYGVRARFNDLDRTLFPGGGSKVDLTPERYRAVARRRVETAAGAQGLALAAFETYRKRAILSHYLRLERAGA